MLQTQSNKQNPFIGIISTCNNQKNNILSVPKNNSQYSFNTKILKTNTNDSEKEILFKLETNPLLEKRYIKDRYYLLFGKYYCYELNPVIGKTENISLCLQWLWSLREKEKDCYRIDDLALIPRKRTNGFILEESEIEINGIKLIGSLIKQTLDNTYILNPINLNIELKGWYEVRKPKIWKK